MNGFQFRFISYSLCVAEISDETIRKTNLEKIYCKFMKSKQMDNIYHRKAVGMESKYI